ncbi:phenylalanine--tRNA ligase, mitochondrial-like [Ornithodoros turicata]|uniref:phenylalanine--tRNA ligase, mitochondrial-like n=1 Tax=Ornithodoros turicata TaxID=34597 RepID=UPI00313A3762
MCWFHSIMSVGFGSLQTVFLRRLCTHRTVLRLSTTATARSHGLPEKRSESLHIQGRDYVPDSFTNVTPRILSHLDRKLHLEKCHPLQLLKQRIVNFFFKNYVNRIGNPIFSVYDRLGCVVTLEQNFDSLLVPADHPSRGKSDSYYVNSKYMLRAHTSAHQRDLIQSGLDSFLVVGDVYRRDEIDSQHYPVFHQVEGVRLLTEEQLFNEQSCRDSLHLFEDGVREEEKQECHTLEADKVLQHGLKTCLESLARHLFGPETEMRWSSTYFPFTHPSWELEVKFQGDWLELLGCGIVEQQILYNAGVERKVGWAFGLGLERIAMKLYNISDIRVFWSKDPGFFAQFQHNDPYMPVSFKPLSSHPPCLADMSFWVPEGFQEMDFFDLVRSVGGDFVERVQKVDVFTHPKTKRTSYCFRIVYRNMERVMLQEEANAIHMDIGHHAQQSLGVELRIK